MPDLLWNDAAIFDEKSSERDSIVMRLLTIFVSGVFLLGSNFVGSPAVAADEWKSASKIARDVKRMKRKGMIPTSLACRNEPGVSSRLKPQAKISWKRNVSKREWAAFLYKGHLDFMPGNRSQIKQWRRLYKKRLRAGASGAIFNCSLWYKR